MNKTVQPRFETISSKKLIGKRITMTAADNKAADVWKSFMPRRKEITNTINSDLISMQVYSESFDFSYFNTTSEFEMWATAEVTDFETVPEEMETYNMTGGLYAVFTYIGPANEATQLFQYIFGTWIPDSDYILDNTRAHFQIIGEKYKHNAPDSEEEVWVPLKHK